MTDPLSLLPALSPETRRIRQYNKVSRWNKERWKRDSAYREKVTAMLRENSEKLKADPEYRQSAKSHLDSVRGKAIDALRKPEVRKKQSETKLRLWKDPAFRARYKPATLTPEQRAERSARMKERWSDPEKRKSLLAGIHKKFTDPKFKAEQTARLANNRKRRWSRGDK